MSPRSLYENQLLTHVPVQHYVYGVPLGRLESQLCVGSSSLVAPLHRLSRLLGPVIDKLIEEYRLLAQALGLRALPVSHREFYKRPKKVKQTILDAVHTRQILMSVLLTLKKRFGDVQARFKNALDHLA